MIEVDSDSSCCECVQVRRVGRDATDHRAGGLGANPLTYCQVIQCVLAELVAICPSFWFRRDARRKLLRQLAEECAQWGPLVRRKAAELRAEAAFKRLQMLKSGDMGSYASLVSEIKASRLHEIVEETERILADLKAPAVSEASYVERPEMLRGAGGNAMLMPHQLQGLRWLVSLFGSHMSGILADDMGLGKTVQTLALLAHLFEKCGDPGPHLVMVPLTTLSHWVDEITLWVPSFRYLVFHGSKRELEAIQAHMGKLEYNIVLSTYDTATNNSQLFSHYPWSVLVVDEGHRIKNCKTRFSQVCRSFPCRHRLLLTGTPIQNSLRELWSLLSFVAPDSFASLDDFEQWFALPPPPSMRLMEDADTMPKPGALGPEHQTPKVVTEEEEFLIVERLHRVLRPFLLRRTKNEVLKDLPEKREVVIWTPISAWQRQLYRKALRGQRHDGAPTMSMSMLLNLRKALNHPYHFLAGGMPQATHRRDHLISASGKFEFLDRMIPRLIHFDHKILIFAQLTSSLDLLEQLLSRLKVAFTRIDGRVGMSRRKQACDLFRNDRAVRVLLLSTRAGGLGLNLQAADTVIIFDSDWNPQADMQAMDRAYRIGQQRPVLVVRLATPTALDRGMFARTGRKVELEQMVISAGQFDGNNAALGSGGHLRQLIGTNRRFAGDVGYAATPIEEASKLLARSLEERAAFEAADLELLGPPAAGEQGTGEDVAERLERCGRLLGAKSVPGGAMLLDKAMLRKQRRVAPPLKRSRKG